MVEVDTPKYIYYYIIIYFISVNLYRLALINFRTCLTTKSSFAIINFKIMGSISAKISIIFTSLASSSLWPELGMK